MVVRVEDWENPRQIIIESDAVLFEVALSHDHCPTCAQRMRHVENVMTKKGKVCNYHYPGGSMAYIALPLPQNNQDICSYIGSMLELDIRKL